jgi:hypothetical protein
MGTAPRQLDWRSHQTTSSCICHVGQFECICTLENWCVVIQWQSSRYQGTCLVCIRIKSFKLNCILCTKLQLLLSILHSITGRTCSFVMLSSYWIVASDVHI